MSDEELEKLRQELSAKGIFLMYWTSYQIHIDDEYNFIYQEIGLDDDLSLDINHGFIHREIGLDDDLLSNIKYSIEGPDFRFFPCLFDSEFPNIYGPIPVSKVDILCEKAKAIAKHGVHKELCLLITFHNDRIDYGYWPVTVNSYTLDERMLRDELDDYFEERYNNITAKESCEILENKEKEITNE